MGEQKNRHERLSESWVHKRRVILLKSKGYQITKENRQELFEKLKKAPARLELPENDSK